MRTRSRQAWVAVLGGGLLLASAALAAAPQVDARAALAERVFADVVAAIGDARTPPTLRLLAKGDARAVQVAWFSPKAHTVFLEQRAVDLCMQQGPDSLAALAVLIGHELAHFYRNHDWAGDFGNGFADLDGEDLQADRDRAYEYELEADIFGGFFGYAAGYNTLGVAPRLLPEIYRVFELQHDLPGYPQLSARQEIARSSQDRLAQLVPVFDAANLLLVLGEHELAADTFGWLARDFPSREILNNAGVACALGALSLMPPGTVRYSLPFELDAHTRLRQGALGQRGFAADSLRVRRLLTRARERFDSARRRDPGYAPAQLNLAALDWLEGRSAAALAHVDEALALARASGDSVSLADAHIVRGVCRTESEPTAAEADFRAALTGRPELARRNLDVLARVPPSPPPVEREGPREVPVGPGSEVYNEIVAEPVWFELSGITSAGDVGLLFRDLGDRRGYVVDTDARSLVLVSTVPNHTGVTARGVRLGDASSRVEELYGAAGRIVTTVDGAWRVYGKARIAFATDADGRVVGWQRYHADVVLGDPAPRPVAFGPRVALVIGNQSYAKAPLRSAAADAQAMSEKLQAAGFEVIQTFDADQRGMVDVIRSFGERLVARGGVGLFYFAGHGVEVDGVNYLIPVGANIHHADEVVSEAIAVDRVVQKMESAGNDVNLVFLDACRNNPYSGTRSGGTGLAQMQVEGVFIAFATSPGKIAADTGPDGHSLFTSSLLQHLLVPGQGITELGYAIRRQVSQASGRAQMPLVENRLTGEFYLVPEGAVVDTRGFARRRATAHGDRVDMVDVDGFRIDRLEVTNEAFAEFLNIRGNVVEDGVAWFDEEDDDARIERVDGRYRSSTGFERYPAVEVTWHGARRFCEWRGAALPTAGQWYRAAGAEDEGGSPWGPHMADMPAGNFFHGDAFPQTAPVGSFADGAGPYGTLDMAGNVCEWVADDNSDQRLVLGGSWYEDPGSPEGLDIDRWLDAAHPNEFTGFRCAAPAASPEPTSVSASR